MKGKQVERLLKEKGLWTFQRNDYKNAIHMLILHDDDDETDQNALQMRELITNHFGSDKKLTDWSKDMFKKVRTCPNDARSRKLYSVNSGTTYNLYGITSEF